MKTKTLKNIQCIMKIARFICSLIIVCCVLGVIGCLLGVVGFVMAGDEILQEVGQEMQDELGMEVMLDGLWFYYFLTEAILSCIFALILAAIARKYFKFEIKEGTPFTFEGAKKLQKTGVRYIILPILFAIINAIVYYVFTFALKMELPSDFLTVASSINIGTGIMMILISLVFKHGAEVSENEVR